MFHFVIMLAVMFMIVNGQTSSEPADCTATCTTFGPGECPPIVVSGKVYTNGVCNGVNCLYQVAVAGSTIGATFTQIQNNCFNE
ncbi:hypothetical protein DdX_16491 [Ditylenchus destructor]|uniref:Uncharacterized protein n=1 Tax=Ditylenchus destructor TaxID=166010 RepID=A0AAD4MT23_9BILA|nr:hypothetical protein DdX_16491 [Ditylenchus destructor]